MYNLVIWMLFFVIDSPINEHKINSNFADKANMISALFIASCGNISTTLVRHTILKIVQVPMDISEASSL